MARIRSIKPEFFKHHELFCAENDSGLPLRVAYSGLWLCCDKEGRFKWKPMQLKLDILPYDTLDFEDCLIELSIHGFIKKYEHENNYYGFIPSFRDHQRITGTEASAESRIPDPKNGNILETTRKQQGNKEEIHVDSVKKNLNSSFSEDNIEETLRKQLGNTLDEWRGKEGKGMEGKGREGNQAGENVIFDIEKYFYTHEKQFQDFCISAQKDATYVLKILKKFHLWNVSKDKYPQKPVQLIAGLQSWILNENEKIVKNGTYYPSPNGSNSKHGGAAKLRKSLDEDIAAARKANDTG